MQEWIQKIMIYVVLVTVLRGLIAKPQYQQYFRFLSGVILIVLLGSPLLSLFGEENSWQEMISDQMFQLDMGEAKDFIQSSEGELQTMIMEQYQQEVRRQVAKMGQESGITVRETVIQLSEEGQILHMDVKVKEEHTKESLRAFRQKLCAFYQVGEDVVVLWI